MSAVAAFVLGGSIALAAVVALWGLRPARPDLAAVTARLDAALAPDTATAPVAFDQRLGERVVAAMTGLGRNYHRLEDDLPLAGVTLAGVIGRCVVFGIVGALLGAVFAAMLAAAGIGLPTPASAAIVVAVAATCSRLPVMATRQRAANRRANFIHALGALLDFLAIQLAAGTGIKDALKRSLDMGGGWAFEVMRDRVTLARDSGDQDWEALEQLGVEFNITELVELGGSIALARTQGATARDTLVAKARALRQRQITAAEAGAGRGTELAAAPIAIQLYAVMFAVMFVLITRLQHGLRA
jgi:Flp pilus assembly protein TadB